MPNIELNARTTDGMTAFIMACEEGHTDVVRLLMYNLQIDLDSTQRKIAFSRAYDNDHEDAVELILNYSVKLAQLDKKILKYRH